MTATLHDRLAPADPEDAEPDETSGAPDDAVPARPVSPALIPWHDPRPWVGWLVMAGVAILAGFTRFWALGFPNQRIFDEAYYPTEGLEIMRFGYEDNRGYNFIVHPPLGKWLLGWSSELFGDGTLGDAFGWRVAPAFFGSLSVIIIARTARRMTRSNVFGAIAGVLMGCEGLSVVLSRTGLLDIFLQFFVVAGFAALVLDRDQLRGRLYRVVADGADLSGSVPSLGPRPWRFAAGVLLGLALAVKWTALSFWLLFWIMSLLWDRGALKAAGCRKPTRFTAWRSFVPSLASVILAALGAYLLTYTGWFVGENGYGRHLADAPTNSMFKIHGIPTGIPYSWIPAPLRALGVTIRSSYDFHESLDSPHPYGSKPWSWLVLGRPVDFYYTTPSNVCGASSCSRQVLLLGTPLMWWAIPAMLLWLAWRYITTHDWRAAAIWVAFLAGWVVWFQDLKRTMFLFYMAPLIPFMVLGLTLALGAMLGPPLRRTGDLFRDERSRRRRRWGEIGVSVYLALVVADFAWMWPIFTGGLLTYDTWHAHMWLPSWV